MGARKPNFPRWGTRWDHRVGCFVPHLSTGSAPEKPRLVVPNDSALALDSWRSVAEMAGR